MEQKTDISYGVVPLYRDEGEWSVLLVHQISHRGGRNTFWILPKGHAEDNESAVEAAERELAEETGVTDISIRTDTSYDVSYSFVHEGVKINKTVQYYIGECVSKDTKLTQPEEILDIQWFTLAEAKEKVSHKNTREVIEKVAADLV